MAELNRVQYSGGYIFGPACESYPQPVNMYGHFFSAAYFSTFVPNNITDQSIQTYPQHRAYKSTQNSSIQSESHCRYASDTYSVIRSVTEQQQQQRDSVPSTFRTSNQCSYSNDSPMSQLRLPKIKTSNNVAANVMMEEADLGYSSLSDYSSLDNTHSVRLDELDISSGSDDVFDDVKSNFSDIIDDVISTVHEDCGMNNEEAHQNNETVIDTSAFLSYQHNNQSAYEPFTTGRLQQLDKTLVESSRDATTEQFLRRVRDRKLAVKQDLKCTFCDKLFNNKTNLTVHLRMHNNIRPHQCPYCEKSFTQKSTMRTHLRTHTGEKPYSCSHCARAFSDYSTYRKHQRVHTGEKPYSCDICHKAFAQSGNMIRHKQTHFRNSGSRVA